VLEMGQKLKLKDIEESIKDLDINSALERLYSFPSEFTIQKELTIPLKRLIERVEKRKVAYDRELERFEKMCCFEKEYRLKGFQSIAGTDEAGRGPLAGPVVAAAVILPEGIFIEKLNDSKKLSAKQRDTLFEIIKEKAICYGIGIVDEKCIDEINILNASKQAMEQAVEALKYRPHMLLIDAVRLENVTMEQYSIIKGDALSISIAAASIIAKVTRDRIIEKEDLIYPQYGFSKHKGYGTEEHINAIKKFGICPIHRRSFINKAWLYKDI